MALNANNPTVFPNGIKAVVVNDDGDSVSITPQSDITSLTDSSGGTADNTVAAITEAANAGSADTAPTANAIADLTAKVNAILVALRAAGVLV